MYTQREINKVLKLYDQTHSIQKVQLILGYPSRTLFKQWLKERRETGGVIAKKGGNREGIVNKEKQRKVAKFYLQNGRNLALTLDELGYTVSPKTIQRWCKRYFPEEFLSLHSHHAFPTVRYSDEFKNKAVLAMREKGRTVISVAEEFGVSRQTLYAWNKERTVTLDTND